VWLNALVRRVSELARPWRHLALLGALMFLTLSLPRRPDPLEVVGVLVVGLWLGLGMY
jgi:hypothetical protein